MSAAQTPAAGITTPSLTDFYARLAAYYGPQCWWPNLDDDNPRFEILVGAVLTQHTAWANVERAIGTLLGAGPLTAQALLAYDDLAELIRRAGPHRVKAERLKALCRWFIEAGGFVGIDAMTTADLCRDLRAIRGIGPETADVIALYAADRPRFIADAYAFRVFERLGWWQADTRRYETLREQVEALAPAHWQASDYDEIHALIVRHAIALCHKRKPECAECPLTECCARIGVAPAW
tara:strand:+ start:251 stop:961 length:711 start_codon:yes stop_codon:yes gene_type:complete